MKAQWICLGCILAFIVVASISRTRSDARLKRMGILPEKDAPITDEQIREAIRRNEKIGAIKLHRLLYKSGLTEAKAAVEKMEAELAARK